MAELESRLLAAVDAAGEVADSGEWAVKEGADHLTVVGLIKSLQASELINIAEIDHSKYVLLDEAKGYLAAGGSPEAQVFNAVPEAGLALSELKTLLPDVGDVGFKQAMQQKWLALDKSGGAPMIVRKVSSVEDKALEQLSAIGAGKEIPTAAVEALKKRKLVKMEAWKTYRLSKGSKFALQRVKPATDLTAEMVQKGTWRTTEFKAYNFNALGVMPAGGHLHPLLKVRTQFRKIFTQMGFEEMPTNNYVESSFWNFDALFQPQQHPARDAHDTFFLTKPAATVSGVAPDYLERVRDVHQNGGYGSAGYGYSWKLAESQKNLLRTHTTAVSSRMLYKLAQDGFRPAKYFSIDRVFRNERIDATHLAEFHQVEGLICDRGLTLGHLIGVLNQFFSRLGLPKLRFKPAYNPYTEPSMEIFSYSEQLKKWMEVGNSGMFRPEMLRPMGLPEDVNVIAWGLSLERPTMILYGIDNIRDLFGHKVSLSVVKRNPICRLGL
uniref:phenylalanine--tRNA ligase n=1 Tax=Chlamydomonas euryale TaxID=1486919 RepID=A0A7R9V8F0_9CHLO|mmetsp:Transcript_22570/g.67213  ORF Transcript_22570/g.67213 Transcript_22570/m.67213 type:complete len:495 (+) Transcript_22570:104-1588(+)